MPETCVAFGCSNVRDNEKGIQLHPIPFYGSDDPQKRKRRKKWVDWIQSKRAHWQPSQFSQVCSVHFVDEDYTTRYSGLTEQKMQKRLRKDELGICVFPSKHAPGVCREEKPAETQRSKRKVRYTCMSK